MSEVGEKLFARMLTIKKKQFSISLPLGGEAKLEIFGPYTSEDIDDIERVLQLAIRSLRRRDIACKAAVTSERAAH